MDCTAAATGFSRNTLEINIDQISCDGSNWPHVDVDEGREVAKPLLNEDVGAALLGEHRGKLCPAQRPRQGDQAAHLSWRDMT